MKLLSYFNKRSFSINFLIDTASLSVSLVEYKKNKNPLIYFVLNESVPQASDAGDGLIKSVIDTLQILHTKLAPELAKVEASLGVKIPLTLSRYILSSSWVVTQTALVSLKKDVPITVDQALVQSLLSTQKEKLKNTASSLITSQNLLALESETVQIRLNGYETALPYGKKTEKIDIAFWLSWIPLGLSEKISTTFPLFSTVKKHSFLLALFSLLRTRLEGDDYVIVDVGSNLSEWVVVKKGVVTETISIPFGYNNLNKKVSEVHGVDQGLSDSALTQHDDSVIDVSGQHSFVGEAQDIWVEEMSKYITDLSLRTYIPHLLYLHAPDQYLSFFDKALEKLSTKGTVANVSLFSVVPITDEFTKTFVDFKEDVVRDSDQALSALFIKSVI